MQRSIRVLGQGTNTAWQAQTATASFYGLVTQIIPQDANFSLGTAPAGPNTTGSPFGTDSGGWAECAFSCVLSHIHGCLYSVTTNCPTLSIQVNVQGSIPSTSPAATGVGNQAAVVPPQTQSNPTVWYDATDIDAITAGQTIGVVETLTASTAASVNPSIGMICDSLNAGFSSPFIFPMQGAGVAGTYITGPTYSRLAGNSGSHGAVFNSNVALSQDYVAGAFVASWLQWQTTATNTDTAGLATAKFCSSSTAGSVGTVSSLAATVAGVGGYRHQHDTTDIVAVPAGSYCTLQWTGTETGSTMRIGNAGIHMSSASSNATQLLSGNVDATGTTWSSPTTGSGATANWTYTTFGHPRGDNVFQENMTVMPTAGVSMSLRFLSGSQIYGGTPSAVYVQRSVTPAPTINGQQSYAVLTTTGSSAWANAGPTVTLSAANTWYEDTTDIAAYLPFDGFQLAVNCARGGSNSTSSISSSSYNSTTGAVTLTMGAAVSFGAGENINVSGITGTGSYSQLNGNFATQAGTTGNTVIYNIATGLTLTTNSGGTLNDFISCSWQAYSMQFVAPAHLGLSLCGAG